MSDNTKRYHDFFLESIEGQEFVKRLHSLIVTQHQKAEDNPELSRDYTQRAKGIREALATINSLTTEAKKGKNTDKK